MAPKLIYTPKERTNKAGKVFERIINVQPKSGFVNIDEVTKVYHKFKKQFDSHKFMIRIQTADKMLTAKSFNYVDDELEIVMENYYSSLSQEGIEKFKQILSFQIVTPG